MVPGTISGLAAKPSLAAVSVTLMGVLTAPAGTVSVALLSVDVSVAPVGPTLPTGGVGAGSPPPPPQAASPSAARHKLAINRRLR